jgi:hypothetical protein
MANLSQIAIESMHAREELQHRRPAHRQTIQRHFQTLIVRSKMKSSSKDISRVLFTVSGNVHFGKVQVELSLAAVHSHGRVAKLFRIGPFLFCRRYGDTHIRDVERIIGLLLKGCPEVGQRLVRVASTQVREAGAKFLERLNLDHDHFLRPGAGFLQDHYRRRLESGSRKSYCSGEQNKYSTRRFTVNRPHAERRLQVNGFHRSCDALKETTQKNFAAQRQFEQQ